VIGEEQQCLGEHHECEIFQYHRASQRSGSYPLRVRRFKLVTPETGTLEERVFRHHYVTAKITLEPHPAFAFGHQLEVVALDTIRTSIALHGPKASLV
jgi:hypothetical protein